MTSLLDPIHPGEILLEDFLKPMELTQYRLAKSINVPAIRISEIVHGKRAISADTALRLAKFFANSAQFWLNLQSNYDLQCQQELLTEELENFVIERKQLELA